MYRIFRKFHRRTKTYYSNYISVIFPGLIIAVFFVLTLNQKAIPSWEPSLIKWGIYIIFALGGLFCLYKFGKWICPDEKSRMVFHNNFFVTIFTTIPLFLLILYNDLIKRDWKSTLITPLILIVYYFISLYVYLKVSKS